MKIILLGYMGSGKTTIGSSLSKKLYQNFTDLDDYIEKKENKTISEIFTEKGEIYFRKIEHVYLKQFIMDNDSYILSLGGGTPCYANNMDFISQVPEL
jgi:shikimate kinase